MTRHFLTLYLSIVIPLAAVSWGQERLWQSYGGGAQSSDLPQADVLSSSTASCKQYRANTARVWSPTPRATPGSTWSCSNPRLSWSGRHRRVSSTANPS